MFPPATHVTTPISLKLWANDKYRCSPTLPHEIKRAEEVAFLLLYICAFYYCLGHPAMAVDLENKVVEDLKTLWLILKVVHGKPKHSQSMEVSKRCGSLRFTTVVLATGVKPWNLLSETCTYDPYIKRALHEALFGSGLEFSISATSLPKDVVDTMTVEESWKKFWRWWTV